MSKILVVYYSRTNNTKKIAKFVAESLAADTEEIKDVNSRKGLYQYVKSAWEALQKKIPSITPIEKDPSTYDLIILGTPVWAATMASPMRTYITQQNKKFKRMAFFCTEGRSGHKSLFKQLKALTGKSPIATLVVKEKELKSGSFMKNMDQFIQNIATSNVEYHTKSLDLTS